METILNTNDEKFRSKLALLFKNQDKQPIHFYFSQNVYDHLIKHNYINTGLNTLSSFYDPAPYNFAFETDNIGRMFNIPVFISDTLEPDTIKAVFNTIGNN